MLEEKNLQTKLYINFDVKICHVVHCYAGPVLGLTRPGAKYYSEALPNFHPSVFVNINKAFYFNYEAEMDLKLLRPGANKFCRPLPAT